MKFESLQEGNTISVIKVSRNAAMYGVHTEIYSDGEIAKESNYKKNIEGNFVDETLDVSLKNYSYAVVLTFEVRNVDLGKIGGYYEQLTDAKIYLKNTKDRTALKEAKICWRYEAYS